MRTNIAESCKAYYESKDFKSDYYACLAEQFSNEEHEIIRRIIDKFNVSNYETEKYLTNWFVISKEQAKKIYDFINDNLESFTKDFSGYYVGYTSLDSVNFGEQEEQLTGLYNHTTGKSYSLPYMQKCFDKAGYYVKGEYAYYNIEAGLHVDLLGNIIELNEFLNTIK